MVRGAPGRGSRGSREEEKASRALVSSQSFRGLGRPEQERFKGRGSAGDPSTARGARAFASYNPRGGVRVKMLAIPAVLAVALAVALVLGHDRHGPLVVSGFVEADEIRVGSRVGGRVARVHVEEGQTVLAGDLLVELELFDLAERRAEAGAELAARRAEHARLAAGFRSEEIGQARARVRQLEARLERLVKGPREQEIEAGRAQLALADAELELARLELERALRCEPSRSRARTRSTARNARRRSPRRPWRSAARSCICWKRARARRTSRAPARSSPRQKRPCGSTRRARASRTLLARKPPCRPPRPRATRSTAASTSSRSALPQDGVVEAIDLRPGDLVPPDAPVLALVDPARLWVRAYVPENRLALELGQEVAVGVDTFPERALPGAHRFHLSRRRVHAAQRADARGALEAGVPHQGRRCEEGLDRLRPGMAADVWLEERARAREPAPAVVACADSSAASATLVAVDDVSFEVRAARSSACSAPTAAASRTIIRMLLRRARADGGGGDGAGLRRRDRGRSRQAAHRLHVAEVQPVRRPDRAREHRVLRAASTGSTRRGCEPSA